MVGIRRTPARIGWGCSPFLLFLLLAVDARSCEDLCPNEEYKCRDILKAVDGTKTKRTSKVQSARIVEASAADNLCLLIKFDCTSADSGSCPFPGEDYHARVFRFIQGSYLNNVREIAFASTPTSTKDGTTADFTRFLTYLNETKRLSLILTSYIDPIPSGTDMSSAQFNIHLCGSKHIPSTVTATQYGRPHRYTGVVSHFAAVKCPKGGKGVDLATLALDADELPDGQLAKKSSWSFIGILFQALLFAPVLLVAYSMLFGCPSGWANFY
ncbi:hypothetical protein AAMO2058_001362200 [Amorphochlora amoebiformis]